MFLAVLGYRDRRWALSIVRAGFAEPRLPTGHQHRRLNGDGAAFFVRELSFVLINSV
jgi:hypothetical protein